MYEETKRAVKKAFEIGKLLFSMNKEDYRRLLYHTSKIQYSITEDLSEEVIAKVLKEKYRHAAKAAGLDERYGMAILQYMALLEATDNE